MYRINIHLN